MLLKAPTGSCQNVFHCRGIPVHTFGEPDDVVRVYAADDPVAFSDRREVDGWICGAGVDVGASFHGVVRGPNNGSPAGCPGDPGQVRQPIAPAGSGEEHPVPVAASTAPRKDEPRSPGIQVTADPTRSKLWTSAFVRPLTATG